MTHIARRSTHHARKCECRKWVRNLGPIKTHIRHLAVPAQIVNQQQHSRSSRLVCGAWARWWHKLHGPRFELLLAVTVSGAAGLVGGGKNIFKPFSNGSSGVWRATTYGFVMKQPRQRCWFMVLTTNQLR